MPLKTKILKILPYWLASLLLAISCQTSFFLISQNSLPKAVYSASANTPKAEVLGASTQARGQLPETGVIEKTSGPDTSRVSARSFLLFDLDSGQTLLQKNSAQKLAIASLTKLMTALVTYQNSDLNKTFTIVPKDTFNISPVLGLASGDKVKALDIFNSMLIGSCNDAALALSDYVSQTTGQNFVELMNKQAADLGMASTSYSNAVGFDSQTNYSTAQDLELLISATQKLAAFTDLGRRESYDFTSVGGRTFSTVATNTLIKNHPDIQAIKTGFTNSALGAMATKVSLDGHNIVILVLDSKDREGDTLKLKDILSESFQFN